MEQTLAVTPAPPLSPLVAIRNFLGCNIVEFTAFWKCCSDEDKAQFKAEIERWDGKSHFIEDK